MNSVRLTGDHLLPSIRVCAALIASAGKLRSNVAGHRARSVESGICELTRVSRSALPSNSSDARSPSKLIPAQYVVHDVRTNRTRARVTRTRFIQERGKSAVPGQPETRSWDRSLLRTPWGLAYRNFENQRTNRRFGSENPNAQFARMAIAAGEAELEPRARLTKASICVSSHLGRRSYPPVWLVHSRDAAGFPLAREPLRCSRDSSSPHAVLVCRGGGWLGLGESRERHC